jgi:uncharacterized membrane protein YhhN
MNRNSLLTSVYLVIGLGELIGEIYQVKVLIYILKPLLIPCLIVYLWTHRGEDDRFPFLWATAALIMSWFGDVFLMLDPKFFLVGLGSFLLAQVAYIIVYSRAVLASEITVVKRWQTYWLLVLLLGYGVYLVWRIQPQLGDKLIPVMIYSVSLLGMVFFAFLRNGRTNRVSYLLVYAGALTFLASDSMIALSSFEAPFWYDRYWIMLTYILAQFLIVNGLVAHIRGQKG